MGGGGLGGLPRIWGPENPISPHSRLGQQEEALEQTDRIKPLTLNEFKEIFSPKKTAFLSNIRSSSRVSSGRRLVVDYLLQSQHLM